MQRNKIMKRKEVRKKAIRWSETEWSLDYTYFLQEWVGNEGSIDISFLPKNKIDMTELQMHSKIYIQRC